MQQQIFTDDDHVLKEANQSNDIFADILRCQEISFVFSQQLYEGHLYSTKAGKSIAYVSYLSI